MSLPLYPSHGQTGYLDGSQYSYDSYTNRWVIVKTKDVVELENRINNDISNLQFNDLADVSVTYTPDHDTVLIWDSDQNLWNTRQYQHDPLGAISLYNEEYTAQEGQYYFRLDHYPIGDVEFIRNGVKISPSAYSVSGKDVYYDQYNNGNYTLAEGDSIVINYNYGTSIALTANLADLNDVDVSTVEPTQGQALLWDSDNQVFSPSSDLQDEINQVVSDRVFSDNQLSKRIDDVDSDLNARGSFYVQATAPSGSANSGWVNTTNMKLYVWDVDGEVWTQVTLT